MNPRDDSPPATPSSANVTDPSISLPKVRSPERAVSSRPFSEFGLRSFRRSNASISGIFNPTNPLGSKRASTPIIRSSTLKNATTDPASIRDSKDEVTNEYRDLIVRSFAPHIALVASSDTEEFLAQKGFQGGLLELLRPYGENVPGRVTIRDSSGSSRSWENYSVHFARLGDRLQSPRIPEVGSHATQNIDGYLDNLLPESSARLRTGGDVDQVEELVEKHLAHSDAAYTSHQRSTHGDQPGPESLPQDSSPYHLLYLRRLLSGLPASPHETFAHPVACVIAISSRHPDPIEELRNLQTGTRVGEQKLPGWISNDYLRYYVLIHDEEHDDSQRSTNLFEQMKRHFGLHCHMLRLQSSQSVPSDDGCVRLPPSEWLASAEELSEVRRRETADDVEDIGPYLYEHDSSSISTFVRELVTQSVIPMMERMSAQWNDQIVSRRRGISGRFLSLSKKWTTFGTGTRNVSSPFSLGRSSTADSSSSASSATSGNSNFDPNTGSYPPSTPEALMRRLADFAFMLRDFKLAQTVYDILKTDYQNDKAWKHFAGASEMSAICTLLLAPPPVPATTRFKTSDTYAANIEASIENAIYSYTTRTYNPYYALRTLAICLELYDLRGGSSVDDAVRIAARILENELVGPVGSILFTERVALCHSARASLQKSEPPTSNAQLPFATRRRKAAYYRLLACRAWLEFGQWDQAQASLKEVFRLYGVPPEGFAAAQASRPPHSHGRMESKEALRAPPGATGLIAFPDMEPLLFALKDEVLAAKPSDFPTPALVDLSDEDQADAGGEDDDNQTTTTFDAAASPTSQTFRRYSASQGTDDAFTEAPSQSHRTRNRSSTTASRATNLTSDLETLDDVPESPSILPPLNTSIAKPPATRPRGYSAASSAKSAVSELDHNLVDDKAAKAEFRSARTKSVVGLPVGDPLGVGVISEEHSVDARRSTDVGGRVGSKRS